MNENWAEELEMHSKINGGGDEMIKMTYNEALKIQAEQLHFYCGGTSPEEEERIRKAIGDKTLPCPFDPDEPKPSWEINELVPRGADIEYAKYGSIQDGN